MSRVHQKKCVAPFFNDVRTGAKTFEVRKNDCDYKVGETVILYEYEPEREHCTGQWFSFIISYVLHGGQFGIEAGYVVLGVSQIIDPLKKKANEKAIRHSERYTEAQGDT